MKNKRILFDISGHDTWIGGVYYMRNIIYQICINEELCKSCTPVIVCSTKFKSLFDEFTNRVELYVYNETHKVLRFTSLIKALINIDYIYYYHKYKFDPFDRLSKKAIYWIPDFQECYYPNYFTKEQLKKRKLRGNNATQVDNPLVLSSQSCYEDFCEFFLPEKKYNVFVIPFVSAIENEIRELDKIYCDKVLEKYNLDKHKFILISNQFWQHKNHIVVFKAIAIAKKLGYLSNYKFVFTGELKDYRNENYYNNLIEIIENNKIEDRIQILGFIDRKEQLALMHRSSLVLQPSLFEGWGTVVEDAKVLDKTIVLSNISVHKEQMNEKSYLFHAEDEHDLLNVLIKALNNLEQDNVEKGIEQMKKKAIEYSGQIKKMLIDSRNEMEII